MLMKYVCHARALKGPSASSMVPLRRSSTYSLLQFNTNTLSAPNGSRPDTEKCSRSGSFQTFAGGGRYSTLRVEGSIR